MQIASYGLSITARIIEMYMNNNVKFSTVGDLGASFSVLRNTLRLCDDSKPE